MKKSAFLLLLTAFISTLFSACVEINIEATATTQTNSNAASDSTLTGQLSDSYIQGLNYIATPSGLNGVTDAFGSFRFHFISCHQEKERSMRYSRPTTTTTTRRKTTTQKTIMKRDDSYRRRGGGCF